MKTLLLAIAAFSIVGCGTFVQPDLIHKNHDLIEKHHTVITVEYHYDDYATIFQYGQVNSWLFKKQYELIVVSQQPIKQ
jgi:hypothetical protein